MTAVALPTFLSDATRKMLPMDKRILRESAPLLLIILLLPPGASLQEALPETTGE
jgi:hypothetical protein